MSGQLPLVEESQTFSSLDLNESASISRKLTTEDKIISDPIVLFLEKYGHEFTRDHKGQLITYYEAMKCPAMGDLIRNLGESVLALTAAVHPEEMQEEAEDPEVEEAEIETEHENEVLDDRPQIKTEKLEKIEPKKVRAERKTTAELNSDTSDRPTIEMSFVEQDIPNIDAAPKKSVATAKRAENPTPPNSPLLAAETATAPSHDAIRSQAVEESRRTVVPVEVKAIRDAVEVPLRRPETEVRETFELPAAEVMDAPKSEPEKPLPPERKPKVSIDLPEEQSEPNGFKFQIPDEMNMEESAAPSVEVERVENVIELSIPLTEHERPLPFVRQELKYEDAANGFSAPVEEIELTIGLLTKKIDALEVEEAETVYQILDEIVEAPKKLEVSAEGEAVNEQEVREELEVLFTDLFDRAGIEYTPELIEDFIDIAINQRLEEIKEVQALDEVAEITPKDRGTHEAITKILIGINNIKKALLRAYALGKSALQLYRLQNAPTY